MLDLTAAARAEYRAKRYGALRRPDEQLNHVGHGILLLNRRDAHARFLVRKRTETKNNPSIRAAHGLTVREQIGKNEFELGADREPRLARRCVAARQAF